jgi:rubrerythrin
MEEEMASRTIAEIIELAIKLEEGTRDFYLKAKDILAGQNTEGEQMLQKLADEEESHKKFLQEADIGKAKDAYVAYEPDFGKFKWDEAEYIKPDMSAKEIQKVALEREEFTRDFYQVYAKHITSKTVRELFETLAGFEQQHVHKIKMEFGHYYGL